MKKERFNPIESSRNIKNEYISYMKSTFDLSNSEMYNQKFEVELSKRSLYKGPYLDISTVFEKGESINSLIEKGVLSEGFRRLSSLHLDRALYKHQEKAILESSKNKNLVISTGTGSGKTESFLIPILDYLIKQKEFGNLGPGVRALLLYPMNALANDQVERLREILEDYPDITYGRYTGETEETEKRALDKYYKYNNSYPKKNELISRERMRATPPNILFTNYSMLEYLMIRPNDKTLFMGENSKEWKFIVLDEAHVYKGANGIEVSLLLRRLKAYLPNKLQYILTSATLGDGEKDLPDIISFAANLCNAEFDDSSVINAVRRPILSNSNLTYIEKSFYGELAKLDFETDNDEIIRLVKSYVKNPIEYEGEHTSSYLFKTIKLDRNLHDLLQVTSNELDLKNIHKNLNLYSRWNQQDLVDFIDVASKCTYNGETLFDSRYHMFVRSLEGAFVSLQPNPQIRLSRHKYIENLVAYEIGVCRYCKSIYVIGYHDEVRHKLYQNEDVDLLETYNEWEEKRVDYFLLERSEEDDSEKLDISEYLLCSICGHIRSSDEINIDGCDCGSQFINKVYKENKQNNSNKLTHCIACNSKSNSNIVRQFFLGKDSATSLIGQFLYTELPNVRYEVTNQIVEKDEFGLFSEDTSITTRKETKKTKQFIAFSDSRQQAAFFAGYFDAEHDRLMRKRVILEVLKNLNSDSVLVKDIVHDIHAVFKKHKLFTYDVDNDLVSESWVSILYELLDVDRRYSLEGLGLVSFHFNVEDITSVPSNDYFKGIPLEQYRNFFEVLLHTFRSVPAINYSDYKMLSDTYRDILDYRRFDNVMALYSGEYKTVMGWVPKQGSNSRLDYVMKALNLEKDKAKDFLIKLWEFFKHKKYIVLKGNLGYKLELNRFSVKNGQKSEWYICHKCNKVTTRNFKNVCPTYHCDGKLEPIKYDEIFPRNFYKDEYKTIPIESISIKEHTAQLDREKAAKYQKDFVEEKLNILSCSTTFEMGVDVGRLETVFLRNIPPSPANYAQRAGRAGRRIDSAAYVLTYCNLSSHDFNFFENPGKMIEGAIKPPHFVIENEKIIKRHVFAVSLSEFFLNNPEFYDRVETFFSNDGISVFIEYLSSKPERLDSLIKEFVPTKIYDKLYKDFSWLDRDVLDEESYLRIIDEEYKTEINDIKDAIKQSVENEEGYILMNLKKLLKTKQKERIINFLSRKNIIPKYGFPVDNVDLVTLHADNNKLNRDLSVAISEYAPGSEIIVDKHKITSRYIKKQEKFALEMNDYFECDVCKKLNIRVHGVTDEKECDVCGNIQNYNRTFIVPKFGFVAESDVKKAKTRKPKKTYSGDIHYVGKGRPIKKLEFNFNGVNIEMNSTGNDELVIMNQNPFFTCNTCGYSKIDMEHLNYPSIVEKHKNYKGYPCTNETLYKYSLAHSFKTDVARITFDLLIDFDEARSILYGLLEGISNYLDIERKDISGTVIRNNNMTTYDFIFFDNVPGGAGHVKRLMNETELISVIKITESLMSRECCDPETSCYTCLRNYYNQKIHDKLRRKYVIDFVNNFSKSI